MSGPRSITAGTEEAQGGDAGPASIQAGPTGTDLSAEVPDLTGPDGFTGWLDYPVDGAEIDADVCVVRGWALSWDELTDRVESGLMESKWALPGSACHVQT